MGFKPMLLTTWQKPLFALALAAFCLTDSFVLGHLLALCWSPAFISSRSFAVIALAAAVSFVVYFDSWRLAWTDDRGHRALHFAVFAFVAPIAVMIMWASATRG